MAKGDGGGTYSPNAIVGAGYNPFFTGVNRMNLNAGGNQGGNIMSNIGPSQPLVPPNTEVTPNGLWQPRNDIGTGGSPSPNVNINDWLSMLTSRFGQ